MTYKDKSVIKIKKMPTKKVLEDYLLGMSGGGNGTYFDTIKGVFIAGNYPR